MGKSAGDYTDAELAEVLAKHGWVAADAARELGVNTRQVQRRAKRIRESSTADDIAAMSRFTPRPLMGLIHLQGGNGLVLGDVHLPITNFELIAEAVRQAQAHGCTDWCIIAGDLFNMDALSDYHPKQDDHDLMGEVAAGRELIQLLLQVFDRVIVTKGNHDIRLQKAMGYRLRFEHTLKMLFEVHLTEDEDARLQVTGRDYVLVDSPMGTWRMCHTRQYSETPLAVPIKIADVNQQHVMGFHRHHYAVGTSRSGKMAVEGGGAFDTDRTEYLVQWSTTHPRWRPGAVLLKDGLPYLPMLAPCPTCG